MNDDWTLLDAIRFVLMMYGIFVLVSALFGAGPFGGSYE